MASESIGKMDQRVRLQSKALARAGGGGSTAAWSTYATVWAEVRPMSGRERESAQRDEATANYEITVRTRSDVAEGHRIEWRGRFLNVRFVRREGPRPRFMKIEAEMGASN